MSTEQLRSEPTCSRKINQTVKEGQWTSYFVT